MKSQKQSNHKVLGNRKIRKAQRAKTNQKTKARLLSPISMRNKMRIRKEIASLSQRAWGSWPNHRLRQHLIGLATLVSLSQD